MALRLGTPSLFLTPCVDIGLTADVCGGDGKFAPFAAPTPFVSLSCFAGLYLLVKVFVRGSQARSSYGATYLDLHLGCVSLAAVSLALSIVLCLTLGPPIARRVAHSEYDDDEELEEQGTDAHLSTTRPPTGASSSRSCSRPLFVPRGFDALRGSLRPATRSSSGRAAKTR